jgi:hypothetical protein
MGANTSKTTGTLALPTLSSNRWNQYYGLYPSMAWTSQGASSAFTAAYSYGYSQVHTLSDSHTQSHRANIGFSRPLNPQWTMSFSESFESTNNATDFDNGTGISTVNSTSPFFFYPISIDRTAYSNHSKVSMGYVVSDKSRVQFSATHGWRAYGPPRVANAAVQSLIQNSLTTTQIASGTVSYSRKISERETVSISYSGNLFAFTSTHSSASSDLDSDYSVQLAPDLTLRIGAGVTQVKSRSTTAGYVGYNATASLNKTFQRDSISFSYGQTTGRPNGLGSTSDSRRAGFSWNRTYQYVQLGANANAFYTRGSLGSTTNIRAVAVNASVGIPISQNLALAANASYQRHSQSSQFAFERQRLYLALRYTNPSFIRF